MKRRALLYFVLISALMALWSYEIGVGEEVQGMEQKTRRRNEGVLPSPFSLLPPSRFVCGGVPVRERARRAKIGQNGPTNPTHRVLAIFATFKGEVPEGTSVPSYAQDLFNPDIPGSFSHFFHTMSGGKWEIEGVALDRLYVSDKPSSAYLTQDPFTREGGYGTFNEEILRKVDQDVDFSQFDNDGPDGIPHSGDDDGTVDFVFLNILGAPKKFFVESATGVASLGLSSPLYTNDQVTIQYGTSQRVWDFAHAVSIMAHEYSHVALDVSLPDLYDISLLSHPEWGPEEDGAGIGSWGLMGFGVLGWNGDDGPTPFCAWSLMKLGWVDVVEIKGDSTDVVVEDVRKARKIYKLPVHDYEYFLIEHRRRFSSYYDRNMPAEGLLIWHVDERAGGNADEHHKTVDLECADGLYADAGYPLGTQPDPEMGMDNLDFWAHNETYRIEHRGNTGDATDVFDGLRVTSFSHHTNPHSNGYSMENQETVQTIGTGIAVTNIRVKGDVLMADFYVNHWSGSISGNTEWRGEVRVFGDVIVEPDAVLSLHSDAQIRVALSDEAQSGIDPERVEIMIAGGLQKKKQGAQRSRFRPFLGEDGYWYGIRLIQDGAWVDLVGAEIERALMGLSGVDVAANIRLSNGSITRSAGDGLHLRSWRGNVELLNGTSLSRNEGDGLYIQGEGTVELRATMDSNKGVGGYLEGVRVKMVSSRMLRNKGDGMVLRSWEEADLRSSSFTDNGGVGLRATGSASLQLSSPTTFKGNRGGGLWVEGGPILSIGARFEGNGTEGAGFGLRVIGGSGWIRNGTFKNEDRAVWLSSSPLQLSESTFENNHIVLLCDKAPLPTFSPLNALTGNEWSVRNETSLTLLAGQNWWGTSDLNEVLERIYGDVYWRPLLASPPRGLGRLTIISNIPNPFGSSTVLRFQVPQDPRHLDRGQWITLRIYNARGQWMRTLADGIYAPGYYVVPWDGRDTDGRLAASGVYLYRLSLYEQRGVELLSAAGRMVLIR